MEPTQDDMGQQPQVAGAPTTEHNSPQFTTPAQPTSYPPHNSHASEQPNQSSAPHASPANSAGVIILQWLTYAFWGWTILALSVLISTILAHMIAGAETGSFTPYGVAAVLVLLPISFVCDIFYSKHEPARKTGGAMAVMVIHAVLFALIGIGSLITVVFTLVSMFTGSNSDGTMQQVTIYSGLIITFIYAAAFLRTLSPAKIPSTAKIFRLLMVVIVGGAIILGIAGPVVSERATKDDRLISLHISSVQFAIDEYARTNKKLPASLSDISLQGDAVQLVDRQLLRYTPNSLPPATAQTNPNSTYRSSNTTHFYTLCTTFKKAKGSQNQYPYGDNYETVLSAYSHPAGEVCYKQKTVVYSYGY